MTNGAAIIQSIPASGRTGQPSPWHSPVPYLFGGMAAMLGLIALALLILACSSWERSSDQENGDTERDIEAGEGGDGGFKPAPPVFEDKFLVIMAGQEKPTFLATPISSRASSFDRKSTTSCCSCSTGRSEKTEEEDEEKKEGNCTCGDSTNQQHVL